MTKESFPKGLEQTQKIERISAEEAEVFRRLIPKFDALRINMDDFEGVYSKEEIERDKRRVDLKKAGFDAESAFDQRAQILEALLAEQIELSEWFGADTLTIAPTEFDDLYHGVDLAAEFQRDDTLQYLAMGVDVTTSQGLALKNKLLLIKDNIAKGELTEMKYFTSERLPDIHGRMGNIPSLVVGADARTIHELADLWLTVDKSKNPPPGTDAIGREELREHAREAQNKLANHRAQVLILKEIEAQLEAFSNLARKSNDSAHKEIVVRFDGLLNFVRETLGQKKISKADEQANESDDVYQAIKANLTQHF